MLVYSRRADNQLWIRHLSFNYIYTVHIYVSRLYTLQSDIICCIPQETYISTIYHGNRTNLPALCRYIAASCCFYTRCKLAWWGDNINAEISSYQQQPCNIFNATYVPCRTYVRCSSVSCSCCLVSRLMASCYIPSVLTYQTSARRPAAVAGALRCCLINMQLKVNYQ